MRLPLLILLLLSCSPVIRAQLTIKLYEDKTYIQKLEATFAQASNDSAKAYAAFKLAYALKRAKDPGKARHFFGQGRALCGSNHFLQGAAYYYEGYLLLGDPDFEKVQASFRKSDSLLARQHHPEAFRIRSNAWLALGVTAQLKGNEKQGLDAYINHALPLARQSKDDFTEANVHKFIGTSLQNAEERIKANQYLTNALSLFEQSQPESNAQKQEAIVEVTLLLAENNIHLEKHAATKSYLDKALHILKHYPRSNAFLFYYVPEGRYYEETGQLQRAISSYDKGIALQSGTIENYYINRARYSKFHVLRKLLRHREAIGVMQDLLKSAILLPGDRNSYYNLLAQTYADAGDMQAAYTWSQKYIAVNDSVQVSQDKTDIMEMEQKYRTAEKEKQILRLKAEQKEAALVQKNQRLLNGLLGGGAVTLFLALLLVFNVYKNNKRNTTHKIKELEQQQSIQLTHAVLEGEERERQRIARDLHDGLGGALSGIKIKLTGERNTAPTPALDLIILQLENAIGELRRIAHNMMPDTLVRSGLEVALRDLCVSRSSEATAIEYQYNGIRKDIPVQSQINIYRIIQELLSNSIVHGKASKIIVQCLQSRQDVFITVEDNGAGFAPEQASGYGGAGINNIRNRVALLKGRLQIESVIGEGTTTNIELHV